MSFNPSANKAVEECKRYFAQFIDRINNLKIITEYQETKRLTSISITKLQTAQM